MNDILIIEKDEGDEPDFESPVNSRWVVAIGVCGNVVVISTPDIHPSFFDNGMETDNIGLPCESEDESGIYQWVCSPTYSTDWESGVTDFEGFDVISSTRLM